MLLSSLYVITLLKKPASPVRQSIPPVLPLSLTIAQQLEKIPTVGPSGNWLSHIIGAFKTFFRGYRMIQEGYEKVFVNVL
jgi:hypothetical protein